MLLTTWKLFIKSSRPRIILTHAIAKNIPQHQQFVESLAKLLEPIRIPSSVLTFAVIRSLASRPGDKGGGSSLKKGFIRPFGPQFGIKIRGGGLDPPLVRLLTNLSFKYARTELRVRHR